MSKLSLVNNVSMKELVDATDEIKDVTIPAVSLFLANERELQSFKDASTQKPFLVVAMKKRHLQGFTKFMQYTNHLKYTDLGKNLLKSSIFAHLLANAEEDQFDDIGVTKPLSLDTPTNVSARLKILDVIMNDPKIKSVDNVFMYVMNHYLGGQRVFLMPKASRIQFYTAQAMRVLTGKYGSFPPDSDAYDADPNIKYIPFGLAPCDLFSHNYTSKDLFMRFVNHSITDYNPDAKDHRLAHDRKMIMHRNFFYVGYYPSTDPNLTLMWVLINNLKDTKTYSKHVGYHSVKLPMAKLHKVFGDITKPSDFVSYKYRNDKMNSVLKDSKLKEVEHP